MTFLNWTWPGRVHVIVRSDLLYLTLRTHQRRLHFCRPRLPHWVPWFEHE